MDDLEFGKRNKRGDWEPDAPIIPAPVFVFPPQPLKFIAWLPHYFLPWNVFFMVTAILAWTFLTPDTETLKTLQPGWILSILLRNMAAVFLIFGALELRLYVKRAQGTLFKYNAKFPGDSTSNVFWFKSQNIDNFIRTFLFGLPIWTAYEVLILWTSANGIGPWTSLAQNPVWLGIFWLIIPVIHEFHFYLVHRLTHVPVLYRLVHSVHHKSANPSPWSSLSMHPVEHLLYWSGALLHLVLPSHPLLALYHIHVAGVGAVVGHIGFDKLVVGDNTAFDAHTRAHYLHHKYFEVNYADGLMPLDRIFGTWHDGSKEGEARMDARMEKKRARMNAGPT